MRVDDFEMWFLANLDLTNKRNKETTFKEVAVGKDGSRDILHCPSGAVFRVWIKAVREPIV